MEKKEKNIEDSKNNKKENVKEKGFAIVNGLSLKISPKYAAAICRTIKDMEPDNAIKSLEDVLKGKRPIPMSGLEVAHKKGKGISGAKFPKNACIEIINLIRQVKANASVNGIENPIIFLAKANRASRPYRRDGTRAKRTHVYIEVRDKKKLSGEIEE